MTLFDVETGEVVGRFLDLGAVHNGIAHADKDLLDLLQNLVHRMLMSHRDLLAGNGDIDRFGGKAGFQSTCLQL